MASFHLFHSPLTFIQMVSDEKKRDGSTLAILWITHLALPALLGLGGYIGHALDSRLRSIDERFAELQRFFIAAEFRLKTLEEKREVFCEKRH